MIRKDFDTYIYYNPNDTIYKEDKRFNKNYRDSLIANMQYREAVEYSKNFYPKNPEKARAYRNDWMTLERISRIYEAQLSKIEDKDRQLVQFVDLLYRGNLSNNVKNEDGKTGNTYIDWYNEAIDNLGADKNNEISITFKPKKQYGLFGWDWLASDNEEYNIERFYENTGLTEAQLKSADIKIIRNNDGSTTIKVNKGHKLFNKIIMGVPMDKPSDWRMSDSMFGGHEKSDNAPVINTERIDDPSYNRLYNIQQKIKSYQDKRDRLFTPERSSELEQRAGYRLSFTTPQLEQAKQAYLDNQLTEGQYKLIKSYYYGAIEEEIVANTFVNYGTIYSNRFNEQGDKTLNPVNIEDIYGIQQKLKQNLEDLQYDIYDNGVDRGILITYKGKSKPDTKIPTDYDAKLENHSADFGFSVFVPNMQLELVDALINQDTNYRANRELADMGRYGYEYETENGALYASFDGRVFLNGEELDRDSAVKMINKDLIVKDAKYDLLYDSLNKDNVIDEDKYNTNAKRIAIKAVSEIYPDVDLFYDFDNTKYSNLEDYIFDKRSGDTVKESEAQNMNSETYNVYDELFKIYYNIMKGLTEHKQVFAQ